MKKTFLLIIMGMLALSGLHSQNLVEKEDFTGNWDLLMSGLPEGDTKCEFVLVDKEGILSGSLKFSEPRTVEAAITNPVIKENTLKFSATLQGYDVDFELKLVDGKLEGKMYNGMFAVTGTKNQAKGDSKTAFMGNWDLLMKGLPQGDTTSELTLTDKDGNLSGTLKFSSPQPAEAALINPAINDKKLTFNITFQEYDIDYVLTLNDNKLEGTMFNGMFTVTGVKSEKR